MGDVYFYNDYYKTNCTYQAAITFPIEYNQLVPEYENQIYTCSSVSIILKRTKDNILAEVKKQIPEICWGFVVGIA
jgi:ribonuclease HII